MLHSLLDFVRGIPSWVISCIIGRPEAAVEEDHPLLKDFTQHQSYATSYAKYPSIRTFYHPHAHTDKLQAIADLPLLVFLHGMGGCLPMFTPLLGSFVNIAPTFGIELAGHGLSEFAPTTYEAFAFDAITDLWKVAIDEICHQHSHRRVVLIGHSLGCSISAALASTKALEAEVVGLIAICPKGVPPTIEESKKYGRLLSLPDFVVNIIRWLDRRGGPSSHSVQRFVDKGSGIDLKRLQLKYNKQFQTPVLKRITLGCLPQYDTHGKAHGGVPGKETWEEVHVPLFLIAGESDKVTTPAEVTSIINFVRGTTSTERIPPNSSSKNASTADETEYGISHSSYETKSKHSAVVKAAIIPSPASHALMYDHACYRTLAGLMEDFLSRHVSHQLELGWQLQQLTTTGKWDVKNLEKWKRVRPVSGPIAGGLFRALKTLREQDEEHTPAVFLSKWADKIFAVIDISHDAPVYDTKTLEKGNVQYHKFPTVSKIPPTLPEVADFIALVDRLREEKDAQNRAIGVHCHYGYNRTGFFVICYLVEKEGWTVQDAIDEFAKQKPPGIKHDHFIDTLFVRYCVGLRRSSTFA